MRLRALSSSVSEPSELLRSPPHVRSTSNLPKYLARHPLNFKTLITVYFFPQFGPTPEPYRRRELWGVYYKHNIQKPLGRGLAKITFSSLCALFPCTLEMRKGSMSHGRGRILYGMLRETINIHCLKIKYKLKYYGCHARYHAVRRSDCSTTKGKHRLPHRVTLPPLISSCASLGRERADYPAHGAAACYLT